MKHLTNRVTSSPVVGGMLGMDDPRWVARTETLIEKKLAEAREAKKKAQPTPDTASLPVEHVLSVRARLKARFPNLTDEELDSDEIF